MEMDCNTDNFNYTASLNTYIRWIDIDNNPLVEDQNDQVTKDAEQKQNLQERNKLLTKLYPCDKKDNLFYAYQQMYKSCRDEIQR